MKNFLLLFCFTIISTFATAQSSDLAWAKRIGGDTNATRNVYGPAVAADDQGNSYIAGVYLSGTYKLDGITLTVPARTSSGGYIAKYNASGQIVWAKPLGNISVSTDNTNKLIVDKEGNIYLCGTNARDAASVIANYYITDGFTETTGNYKTHFIAKLDTNGNVLWVKTTNHPYYVSSTLSYVTNELFFDKDGNANMTGVFRDYITFDENNNLTTNSGEVGVYFTKYSPNGEVLSAKLLEDTYPENQYYNEQVKSDASGNLYRWSNRKNTQPGKILYRYTAEGDLIDTKTVNMSSSSNLTYQKVYSTGFAVTPAGDVLIGGFWFGTTLTIEGQTFTGHSSNSNDQAEQSADAFVLKLKNTDYTVDWVYLEKSSDRDEFTQLLSDGLGNIYAAGKWGSDYVPPKIRIRKLNLLGQPLWQKIIDLSVFTQNGQRDLGALAQTQNGGNIWVSGYYRENIRFSDDYIFTTPVVTSGSFYNGFLAKYGTCNTENPVINVPADTELCEGESLTLYANISNPALAYFWSTPAGNLPAEITESTAVLTVTQPGKYALIAQENAECYGKSQEVWITQIPKPDNGVTLNDHTLTATATGEGISYQWLDCDNGNYPIDGATEQSFTPQSAGNYAVQITNAKGCSVISECRQIQYLGVNELQQNAIVLYPNPTDGRLFLKTNTTIKEISIINMLGQTLLSIENTKVINVSALPAGYYFIKVKTDKGIWNGKFIKE